MFKTVLNYPKDKIYLIDPFYRVDDNKIIFFGKRVLSQLLYTNGQRGDHMSVANSLIQCGKDIKEKICRFLDNEDMKKGVVKIGDIITPFYERRIKNHPYFMSITKEEFCKLKEIVCIEYRDGILVIDGNHRVVVYYNTDYPAVFNIY